MYVRTYVHVRVSGGGVPSDYDHSEELAGVGDAAGLLEGQTPGLGCACGVREGLAGRFGSYVPKDHPSCLDTPKRPLSQRLWAVPANVPVVLVRPLGYWACSRWGWKPFF